MLTGKRKMKAMTTETIMNKLLTSIRDQKRHYQFDSAF